jgi:hypothetical protein
MECMIVVEEQCNSWLYLGTVQCMRVVENRALYESS